MHTDTTPKEMPTGNANSTAGDTINDLAFPTAQRADQALSKLCAAFALRGHALHRTHPNDGGMNYLAERWGLVKYLPTIDAARRFLEQIGGRL